jgi:hypothetical protein
VQEIVQKTGLEEADTLDKINEAATALNGLSGYTDTEKKPVKDKILPRKKLIVALRTKSGGSSADEKALAKSVEHF